MAASDNSFRTGNCFALENVKELIQKFIGRKSLPDMNDKEILPTCLARISHTIDK